MLCTLLRVSGKWSTNAGRWLKPVAVALIVACVAYTVGTLAWSNRPGPEIKQARIQSLGPRVVYIGDSYTAGAGSADGGWVKDLNEWRGWEGVNLGVGGTGYVVQKSQDPKEAEVQCESDYCRNFPEVIAEAQRVKPRVVIVSGGRNNAKTDSVELDTAVPAFYAELRKALPNAQIFATSPLWDATPPPPELAKLAERVKAAVTSVKGVYLDLGQPLQGHADWIALRSVNPNDRGHDAIARAVTAALPEQVP